MLDFGMVVEVSKKDPGEEILHDATITSIIQQQALFNPYTK